MGHTHIRWHNTDYCVGGSERRVGIPKWALLSTIRPPSMQVLPQEPRTEKATWLLRYHPAHPPCPPAHSFLLPDRLLLHWAARALSPAGSGAASRGLSAEKG